MLPTLEELRSMMKIDIMKADREELTEIGDIRIDERKSVEKRVEEYLEQVTNPFLVRSGAYILKFAYTDCEEKMEDRMIEYISGMAKVR